MDITQGSKCLGIADEATIAKAKEYLRQVDVRSKGRGLRNDVEVAKSMVCLDLACQSKKQDYDRSKLIKFAGIGEKEYQLAFATIQGLLKIKTIIDLPALAIKFGCARIQESATRNLQAFQKAYLQHLPAYQRANCNFESPVYPAVALYLTAFKAQLKVEKTELLQAVNCHSETFEMVYAKWTELFPSLKPHDGVKKEQHRQRTQETKAPKSKTSETINQSALPSDGIHAPPAVDLDTPRLVEDERSTPPSNGGGQVDCGRFPTFRRAASDPELRPFDLSPRRSPSPPPRKRTACEILDALLAGEANEPDSPPSSGPLPKKLRQATLLAFIK